MSTKGTPAKADDRVGQRLALPFVASPWGETMVHCSCCHQLVAALVEVPSTRQLVCSRCLTRIRGMLGVWDVLIGAARQRTKPGDA